MLKEKNKLILIALISLFLLGGCGDNTQKISNDSKEILEAIVENDFSVANIKYNEAVNGLTKDEKILLDENLSEGIIEEIETRYKKIKPNNGSDMLFLSYLNNINDMDISNKDLTTSILTHTVKFGEKSEDKDDTEISKQEKLESDFAKDIENLNTIMNNVQQSISPIVNGMLNEDNTYGREDLLIVINNLDEYFSYFKNMQDYTELVRYKETYQTLVNGTAKMVYAYSYFKQSYEEDNVNPFFNGMEYYNTAIDEFVNVGTVYAKESEK
ncbi:hypothetical protein [Ureibacillus acetophenoni]|uniref:Lipoprotein n=1 Tax=Ureibacillus acetophenoni TaxID=614649 RepID=A0A285UT44_9BACL|nr:hypothetical protein [Ureibacillus acetophenoni]SOC43421.1 hypothetical protein SAMN05877842_1166 [Ureibacillus acetophenoni]